MRYRSLAAMALLCAGQAAANEPLIVVQSAWDGLTAEERASLQSRHLIDLRQAQDYGLIIDNQGIDESTNATHGGAVLGGALAQTAYIDRAFRGGNYSATTQLGLGLLGALLGSSLDNAAVRRFHFRYALRLRSGDIVYRDSVQSDAFRHPAGMCLSLSSVAPAPQTMCTQTADTLRRDHLTVALPAAAPALNHSFTVTAPPPLTAPNLVTCKVANLPPFSVTPEKCNSIGGLQQ